jgi:hypothetical protein
MLSSIVVAGEIKLINPSSNKETALLKMKDKDNWEYMVRAKPGETVVKNLKNGTYCWILECPEGTIIAGHVWFYDHKWHCSEVVVSDDHGVSWTVEEGH